MHMEASSNGVPPGYQASEIPASLLVPPPGAAQPMNLHGGYDFLAVRARQHTVFADACSRWHARTAGCRRPAGTATRVSRPSSISRSSSGRRCRLASSFCKSQPPTWSSTPTGASPSSARATPDSTPGTTGTSRASRASSASGASSASSYSSCIRASVSRARSGSTPGESFSARQLLRTTRSFEGSGEIAVR